MPIFLQMQQKAGQTGKILLDFIYPPRCGGCGAFINHNGGLCSECWKSIHFLIDPLCTRCGHPFPHSMGDESYEALCGECIREDPPFDALRSVFRYEEASKCLILTLKYYGRTMMLPTFSNWLQKAGQNFLPRCELIVPVPIHPLRLLRRRYNQAALMAYALGKKTGIPVLPDALRRTRYTPPQSSLTRAERLENVRGVFAPHPRRQRALEGKTVLLIDDVMTTAATIAACCKALRKGGAAGVYVLTLARTVRD